MKPQIKTVSEYIASLPADRKKDIKTLRSLVKKNLPKGFKESFNWGMIAYEIPLSVYPDTYNKKPLLLAAIGSQKNYMVLHLCSLYIKKEDGIWFRAEYKKSGKKLDMGAGCVRFKSLEQLPLDLIAQVIRLNSVRDMIALHEALRKKKK